ncbi:MAG: hypothetical protein HOQ05_08715 [Corynebacteriales bacterium]|nr:hypothetical protein [Mycobacteriales bacterium]
MRHWAIDAGGSSTTVLLDDGTKWKHESVNAASVGTLEADRRLSELLRAIAQLGPTTGWLATATVGGDAPHREVDRLTHIAEISGLAGTLVISGDVLPLLLAAPLRNRGVAVVCGTGSGFLASDGVSPPISVGGCEYLGSDEGSAFALGLAGLRAAVRASDGRGPATALELTLAENTHCTVRELARRLAAEPFPKAAVAALAGAVCRCWLTGDAVASEIVAVAITDLLDGVRAARDAANLTTQWSATLNGGVFRGCPEFAEALADKIVRELGADNPPSIIDDPPKTVLAALREHPRELPAVLADRWAWHRSMEGTAT